MEKVMLSKLEAAALESALEASGGDRTAVSCHHSSIGIWTGDREPLNSLDLETINMALYVGYEIEPDPEEEVLELYQSITNSYSKVVIEDVLNILNIKIKGINCNA